MLILVKFFHSECFCCADRSFSLTGCDFLSDIRYHTFSIVYAFQIKVSKQLTMNTSGSSKFRIWMHSSKRLLTLLFLFYCTNQHAGNPHESEVTLPLNWNSFLLNWQSILVSVLCACTSWEAGDARCRYAGIAALARESECGHVFLGMEQDDVDFREKQAAKNHWATQADRDAHGGGLHLHRKGRDEKHQPAICLQKCW